jgi:hypothetical protein
VVEAGLGDQLPETRDYPTFGALIAWYHNTSVAAWIYLGMQCTYGVVWVMKDVTFPDPNLHKRITIGAGIASFLSVLGW